MFFVLNVTEKESSLYSRVSDYFHSPEVLVQKVESGRMLPFYRINTSTHHGKIPWREIEKAAGKLCGRAILQDGIVLPEDTKIKKYEPAVFPKRVLFNSAVSVLERLRLDPVKMSITVFDENGYLTDLIERLVYLCSSIRIITSCAQSYEQLKERLFEKYGISVIISAQSNGSILTSTAIIADNSSEVPLIYHGLLFTGKKRQMLNATVLCGGRITLTKKAQLLYTPGIDKLTFASALYELCSLRELENTIYDDMKI